jgi:hypothetical protein
MAELEVWKHGICCATVWACIAVTSLIRPYMLSNSNDNLIDSEGISNSIGYTVSKMVRLCIELICACTGQRQYSSNCLEELRKSIKTFRIDGFGEF